MSFVVERLRHRPGAVPPSRMTKPAPRPTSTSPISVEFEALAERIGRIRSVGRNGDTEPFYLDRSQAKRDAQLLSQWQQTGCRPAEFVLAADRGVHDEHRTRYSQR